MLLGMIKPTSGDAHVLGARIQVGRKILNSVLFRRL
jgi:hypothetical protein